MTALAKKKSPAERLHADGWRTVFQFLDGNDIAKVLGVSWNLRAMGGKDGIWSSAVSTVMPMQTASPIEEIRKWRILGNGVTLKGFELAELDMCSEISSAIPAIILSVIVSPNMQQLSLLQLPATQQIIEPLIKALRGRANSGRPLKSLVLELKWPRKGHNWDCGEALMEGLPSFPEEVELNWLPITRGTPYAHLKYRDAVLGILSNSKSILNFTLPGCLWADYHNDLKMYEALSMNTTLQSLVLTTPVMPYAHMERTGGEIKCFARMLMHPSLRHLSIADYMPLLQPHEEIETCNYSALYFTDRESFLKSSIKTLHLEMKCDAPYGLLSVLHSVADMPQLERFTINWPNGGHLVPKQISMERLRKFLETSPISKTYKQRHIISFYGRYCYEQPLLNETLLWSTLVTLFV
jgi:hypothetical protein